MPMDDYSTCLWMTIVHAYGCTMEYSSCTIKCTMAIVRTIVCTTTKMLIRTIVMMYYGPTLLLTKI